jgi:hypothetical protein
MKNTGNWPQIPKLCSFCGENRSDRPWGDILLTTVCERLSKASFQNIKSKRNLCFSTEDSIEDTEPKVNNKCNGDQCRPLALSFYFPNQIISLRLPGPNLFFLPFLLKIPHNVFIL